MASRSGAHVEHIHVLIADNTRMGSELLAGALQRDSRFTIVGCAPDWNALSALLSKRPQVTIIAADFERASGGLEATRKLLERDAGMHIVMLLDEAPNANSVVDAFRAGVRGIFSRADSANAMGKCISSVHQGQVWATAEQLGYLLDALRNSAPPRFVDQNGISLLTNREQDVVRYVADGMGNREIAQKMKLSEHTVKNHLFRIYSKLGIASRVEIMFAVLSQRPAARAAYVAFQQGAKPKSDAELFQWYLQQTPYAHPYAQYMVGKMYLEGRGVERDELAGYMWLLLAEENANEVIANSRTLRKDLATLIDNESLAEARRDALKRWQDCHPGNGHIPQLLSAERLAPKVDELAVIGSIVEKAG